MQDLNHISAARMFEVVAEKPPLHYDEWLHMESCGTCRAFANQFVLLTGVIEGSDLSSLLKKPVATNQDNVSRTKTA